MRDVPGKTMFYLTAVMAAASTLPKVDEGYCARLIKQCAIELTGPIEPVGGGRPVTQVRAPLVVTTSSSGAVGP